VDYSGAIKIEYGLKQVEKTVVVYNQDYVSNHDRCHRQDRDGVENIIKWGIVILCYSMGGRGVWFLLLIFVFIGPHCSWFYQMVLNRFRNTHLSFHDQ
jgi:hypothetical protein